MSWAYLLHSYFKYPFYDISTAAYAEENKNPFAIGEFATLVDGDLDAGNFTGSALVREPTPYTYPLRFSKYPDNVV